MSQNILFLAHVDESGTTLPKAAYEVLGAALDLAKQLGSSLTIGLIGGNVEAAAKSVTGAGAQRIVAVSGPDFAHPRYASDAAAIEAICQATAPGIVIAPGTSRFSRVLPGMAHRLKGQVDTHLTSIELIDGALTAKRWFYRQRLEAVLQRNARPWILLLDSGCHAAWAGEPASANSKTAAIENIAVTLSPAATRTIFSGVRAPSSGAQTIRPDAKLLFV